ncbi:MAG: hypothetical protein KDA78_13720 [Planctomycetaceae bacterium]|nr:hypothetical protein [Planctomycetaceae bacterium]
MRNEHVYNSVKAIVSRLDELIQGGKLKAGIPRKLANTFDKHVDDHGGSVRLACVFFVSYILQDSDWDFASVPVGIRGKFGDKLLSSELSQRHVMFHKNITAFGENLGWKGNVRNFDMTSDTRFKSFVGNLKQLSKRDRKLLFEHVCWRLLESRHVRQALPPLPNDYLTYSRSLNLCESLLGLPSEGHVQQFLIASFLLIHRARFGHHIMTHHPHASDKYNGTCGDIEEFRDELLVAAYEVTVRDDWKNRLPDFRKKMQQGKLKRYVIFAANVNNSGDLFPAANLVKFTEGLEFDLAIVDVRDFCAVFCAELSAEELIKVVNQTYAFLQEPSLCGRSDLIDAYRDATARWVDDLA